MTQTCVGCGRSCERCSAELNNLELQEQQHKLSQYEARIRELLARSMELEEEIQTSKRTVNPDMTKLEEEHLLLRDRYERLEDSHKNQIHVNQEFEGKMTSAEELCEAERKHITEQNQMASERAEVKEQCYLVMQAENDRLRRDCRLAASLLQNNAHLTAAHRLSSLSDRIQQQVLRLSQKAASSTSDSPASPSDDNLCTSMATTSLQANQSKKNAASESQLKMQSLNPMDLLSKASGDINSNAESTRLANQLTSSRFSSRRTATESASGHDPFIPVSIIAEAMAQEYGLNEIDGEEIQSNAAASSLESTPAVVDQEL